MKDPADQIRIVYSHFHCAALRFRCSTFLVTLCSTLCTVLNIKVYLVFYAYAGGDLSASCSFDKLTDPAAL
jgi:hypothetical protein